MSYPLPSTKRKPKVLQLLFFSFIVLSLASLSASLGALTALILPEKFDFTEPDSNILDSLWQHRFKYTLSRPVNILLLGIDGKPNPEQASNDVFKGRSDTVILARFEPKDKSISLLSIPRDTQVDIPNYGIGKISEINYWGDAKLATQVVKTTLNQVEIPRYVRVSSGAFRELVNLLGGVEVYIPQRMSYQDNAQQLKIDLSPGWQTLNGEQADQFARFRGDGYADVGRIQRQQALIEAILTRIKEPSILPRLPEMIRIMEKYIDTNLSFEEILTLVNFGLKIDEQKFKMVTLPGRSSGAEEADTSYWIVDERGRDRVMFQYFRIDSTGFVLQSTYEPSAYETISKDTKIAVQNASGNPKAGEKMINLLAEKGFEAMYVVPNSFEPQRQTEIIAQGGDLGAANLLQQMINVGKIKASSTGELESDLTIRIGEDWLKN